MTSSSPKKPFMLCKIYRSERREGTYLYVPWDTSGQALNELPEALKQALGQLTEVMTLKLSAERKLANADINKVMSELTETGFYLQLPPLEQDSQRWNVTQ